MPTIGALSLTAPIVPPNTASRRRPPVGVHDPVALPVRGGRHGHRIADMPRVVCNGDLVSVEDGITERLDGTHSAQTFQQHPIALPVRGGDDPDGVRPHVRAAGVCVAVCGLAVGDRTTKGEDLPAVGTFLRPCPMSAVLSLHARCTNPRSPVWPS